MMTSDEDHPWNDLREERRARRAWNLKRNTPLLDGWTHHTDYHYSRTVALFGKLVRVDFWPSANKWCVGGVYYRGSLPKRLHDVIHPNPPVSL